MGEGFRRGLVASVALAAHVIGLWLLLRSAGMSRPPSEAAPIMATVELPPLVPQKVEPTPPTLVVPAVQVPEPLVQIAEDTLPTVITATYTAPVVALPPPPPPQRAAPKISPDAYPALISAQLAAVQEYPATARRASREGTAFVLLKLDRSGRVIGWRIVRSAGDAGLDAEIARMIAAADPFPPFPDSMTQAQQSFSVPISFTLKRVR